MDELFPRAVSEEVALFPNNTVLGEKAPRRHLQTLRANSDPSRQIYLYRYLFTTIFGQFHRGYQFHGTNRPPRVSEWEEDQHRGVKSVRMEEYHMPGARDRGENPDNEILIRAHVVAQSGVDIAYNNHVILPERIISNRTQENLRNAREKYYFALYPLASGGDMFESLQGLSEDDCRPLFRQVFQGVQYLHNLGIFHNDLKPENVVTNEEQTVAHIIDFGQAIIVENPNDTDRIQKTGTGYGTTVYSAPEFALSNRDATFDWRKADIWALGVTLYMMLAKSYPSWHTNGQVSLHRGGTYAHFLGPDSHDRFPNFLRNNHGLPFRLSEEVINLLHRMLIGDVNERISMEDILTHPWLDN